MNSNQFQELIERYISDESTPQDIKTLRFLLQEPEYIAELDRLMDRHLEENTFAKDDYPQVVERLKQMIDQRIEEHRPVVATSRFRYFRRWAAAAAILAIFITTAYIWISKRRSQEPEKQVAISSKINIEPGKQGAILTLSDGSSIVLDTMGNGLVATQKGSKILLDNGQLIYNADGSVAVAYNTVSTPKGRQFQLVLQDGTKVWLNAASSIRYPTAFVGKERKVDVTGEAYFEVAKNEKMPFHVKVNNKTEVVVLGTHFNINSYSNEASINTTLLEGSVQIAYNNEKAILKPGQQAQIMTPAVYVDDKQHKIKIVDDVNLEKVIAWKNGIFNFQDATLKDVMRQLERWYDIEVVYEKGVPDIEFMGKIERDLSLSEVLNGLKLSEVNFRIEEGRKLVVTP